MVRAIGKIGYIHTLGIYYSVNLLFLMSHTSNGLSSWCDIGMRSEVYGI